MGQYIEALRKLHKKANPAAGMTYDDMADRAAMDSMKGVPFMPQQTTPQTVPQGTGMLGDLVQLGADPQRAQQISDKLKNIKTNIQAGMRGGTPQTAPTVNMPAGMTNDDMADRAAMDSMRGESFGPNPNRMRDAITGGIHPATSPTPNPISKMPPLAIGAKKGEHLLASNDEYILTNWLK